MNKKTWIAVGAASALGLGVMAGGAVASAHELSLTSSDDTAVPGLTSGDGLISGDGSTSGTSADVTFDISSDSIVSPAVASVASPESVVTPAEVSAVSPVSPASVASPASVPSAVSAASVEAEDVDSDD